LCRFGSKILFNEHVQALVAAKPNIYEIDLHDSMKRKEAPLFAKLFHSDVLVETLQEVENTLSTSSQPRQKPELVTSDIPKAHGKDASSTEIDVDAYGVQQHSKALDYPFMWSKLVKGEQGKTIKLQINVKLEEQCSTKLVEARNHRDELLEILLQS
jgi:hypothetical protein